MIEGAEQQVFEPQVSLLTEEPHNLVRGRGRGLIRAQNPVAWRDAVRRRMLAGADVVAVVTAICVVHIGGVRGLVFQAALIPVWIVLAKLYGLYDNDHRVLRHLTVDELPNIVAWTTTATAAHMLLLSLVTPAGPTARHALVLWAVAVGLAPPLRAAARAIWRRAVPADRAVLIGSGPLESATRRKLELFCDIHVVCVHAFSDGDPILVSGQAGECTALEERIGDLKADRVIVASANASEALIAELVRICRRRGLKLSVVPPARGMFGTAVNLHHVADLPFMEYNTWNVPRSTLLLKRIFDAVLAASALVLVSPVIGVIAIAIRLEGGGPVFFVDPRAGENGKPFKMIKFRTMTRDASHRLHEVVDLDKLRDPMFKLVADPRITRLGRFLRRTSLDEVPQLINVVRGDMTLVGPRPEQLEMVARYKPEHRFRLTVKPGLTGPMQVYGRGRLSFEERLAVEREYVDNLSLSRDLRLLLLTIGPVVLRHGAF